MKLEQLMRPEVKDDWGIKELQNCILNIAKYIHNFCEEYNIQYCIMGGTALGAVRHGGFIPWDDDLDIFMTPNEYLKFRDAFILHGDKNNYYLQELGRSGEKVVYAKLRLNNSFYIEDAIKKYDIHQGVYVDIMIQHIYPSSRFSRFKMVGCQSYLEMKALANRDYYKRGFLFNLILRPLRWLPKRFLLNYSLNQIWKYKDRKTDNYFHYYVGQPLARSVYPSRLFQEYKLVDFETIKMKIPSGVSEYLTILFGDYMRVPNIESIKWHQHTNEWSPDTPFTKVGKGTFEYEKNLW